ncbi:MAG: type II toxin-antitoxin system PemK/MazF family toxin [SAR324 cluster bacterium]|nr:type II toxin-antitoxin system PemK/MazF family toxin [SAR324 cluster bacterium]
MVKLTTGIVVLIPFPFSDLSKSKLRPAVVLADVGRDDWVLCQITSNPYGDHQSIPLTEMNFATGSLPLESYVRPDKLFTANNNLVLKQVGTLNTKTFKQIIDAVINILYRDLRS